MSEYRKKPVVIEAFQMTAERRMDNSEWPVWLGEAWNGERDAEGTLQRVDINAALPDTLEIVTLKGKHLVTCGDYIIRGVKGELYPCKPDIFAATYEPAALPAADLERAWKMGRDAGAVTAFNAISDFPLRTMLTNTDNATVLELRIRAIAHPPIWPNV